MHPTECTFTASGFRREEFDHFMSIARELGIKVDCAVSSSGKTATVHVSDMPGRPGRGNHEDAARRPSEQGRGAPT